MTETAVASADPQRPAPQRRARLDCGIGTLWIVTGNEDFARQFDDLRGDGIKTLVLARFRMLTDLLAEGRVVPGAVVIDLDSFDGVGALFARLRRLRDTHFDIPVLLVSAGMRSDDLTTERLAIGDVSLRAPVSRAMQLAGLIQAVENNRLWQARLVEMRLDVPARGDASPQTAEAA